MSKKQVVNVHVYNMETFDYVNISWIFSTSVIHCLFPLCSNIYNMDKTSKSQ